MPTTSRGLQERRRALGLSQVDLASRSACSVSYLQQLEEGINPFNSDVRRRIERELAVAEARQRRLRRKGEQCV